MTAQYNIPWDNTPENRGQMYSRISSADLEGLKGLKTGVQHILDTAKNSRSGKDLYEIIRVQKGYMAELESRINSFSSEAAPVSDDQPAEEATSASQRVRTVRDLDRDAARFNLPAYVDDSGWKHYAIAGTELGSDEPAGRGEDLFFTPEATEVNDKGYFGIRGVDLQATPGDNNVVFVTLAPVWNKDGSPLSAEEMLQRHAEVYNRAVSKYDPESGKVLRATRGRELVFNSKDGSTPPVRVRLAGNITQCAEIPTA